MAAAAPEPAQRASNTAPANLNLNNIASNNPFRNRMSTASPSPRSPDPTVQQYPFPAMSRNPFLDPADKPAPAVASNGDGVALADDIFKDLSLLDKPATNGTLPSRSAPPPRPANLPPPGRPMGPPGERRNGPPRGPPRGQTSPPKRPEHRRRASETSVMERDKERDRQDRRDREREKRPPRTESEERRRRERRKEREERYKREGRDPKSGARLKPQRNLDLIDKLDVTGIYGEGLFHHDGPFDACNPHRNAKKDRRAPMQAFPEGSANMAMGGSGPLNSRLDLDRFHGRGDEGFQDYGNTRKTNTPYVAAQQYVNPHDRTEQVHGEESYGLGTSTFLEGAPATKKALERRESDDYQPVPDANAITPGGSASLQRKKSLAQRLRGMSASQRRGGPGDIRSPEARYNSSNSNGATSPPLMHSISAGGRAHAYSPENEVNPFDNEYDAAFEKKGAQIRIAEQEKPSGASSNSASHGRAPSSPRGGGAALTRSVTADAALSLGGEEKPSLLNRMKSLKGGRRGRPERKESGAGI